MKSIFQLLLITAPLAALVLFFSQMRTEEVKNEQRHQHAVQKLEDARFDQSFDDAWGGRPSQKVLEERSKSNEALKREIAAAKAKRDDLDQLFDEDNADMRAAIKEEDERLAKLKNKEPQK
ncbi:MAG: hypothetical protein AB1540_15245 [Bdellovibrionota bacterium]